LRGEKPGTAAKKGESIQTSDSSVYQHKEGAGTQAGGVESNCKRDSAETSGDEVSCFGGGAHEASASSNSKHKKRRRITTYIYESVKVVGAQDKQASMSLKETEHTLQWEEQGGQSCRGGDTSMDGTKGKLEKGGPGGGGRKRCQMESTKKRQTQGGIELLPPREQCPK